MAWIISENKLDSQQRSFLDTVDIDRRNVWIKGFAGSGKSILLVFTAKKILSRKPSAKILMIVFTQSLVEMFKSAFKELGLRVSVETYYGFMKESSVYDYILCDEVQDLTPRVIREMNSRSNHIIVAGDANQSIFESDPRWHEATVTPSEISRLISGDAFELNIIHRLSRSIIDAVQKFLPRMNIFSSKRVMTKSDTQIRLCEASSEGKEVEYIMRQANKAVSQGYTAGILIPTQNKIITFVNYVLQNAGKPTWTPQTNQYGKVDFGALNRYLQANGIKLKYVGNGYGNFNDDDHNAIIMTFHSAKGLDFDNVFIPFANSSMFISADETMAKTLFMVAMTRSRQNLFITYYGYPSDYLDSFKSNCSHIDIASANTTTTHRSGSSNPWGG